MPAPGTEPGAPDSWPTVRGLLSTDISTDEQAEELLSDFCPWGVNAYVHLRSSGLTQGLNWAVLPPYAKPFTDKEPEKLASFEVRNVPAEVAQDVQRVVDGRFVLGKTEGRIEWLKPPQPTFTVWYVHPGFHEMTEGQQLALVLKGIKLIKAGPLALILDEAKGLAAHHFGKMWGEGSPVYCATGLASNFLDISMDEGDWFMPGAMGKGQVGVNVMDGIKGGLMAWVSSKEDAAAQLLYDGIALKDPDLTKAFGKPKTYDGDPMPAVIIRADVLGFEPRRENRYVKAWHVNRYYRLDIRAAGSLIAPYEDSRDRGKRKEMTWEGTTASIGKPWKRLPDEPKLWGTHAKLLDFAPKGQLIRIKFPTQTEDSWRYAGAGSRSALVAELVLPGKKPNRAPVVSEIKNHEALFLLYNATHGVLTPPSEWLSLPTKEERYYPLYRAYRIRVVHAMRKGSGYTIDGDMTRTLDEFRVQVMQEPGKPVTGTASYPEKGYVQLDYTYHKSESLVVESSGKLPMKPRLGLIIPDPHYSTAYTEKDDTVLKENRWTFRARAVLTPASIGWHHLLVNVSGKDYHIWDRVERIGQPAIFDAWIPALPGRHRVTLVASEGAQCARTLGVEIAPVDDSYSQRDLQQAMNEVEAKRLELQQHEQEDAKAWLKLRAYTQMLEARNRVGRELMNLRRYRDAQECFTSVVRAPRQEAWLAKQDDPEEYGVPIDDAKTTALFYLPEVAFYLHQPNVLLDHGKQWLAVRKKKIETPKQEKKGEEVKEPPQKPSTEDYVGLARDTAKILRWYVLLGGSSGCAELHDQYRDALRKAGFYDARTDILNYLYRH